MQPTIFNVPTSPPFSRSAMAQRINDSLAALLSSHAGAARPSYVVAGTTWVSTALANTLLVYIYDGAADVLLHSINTVTHVVTSYVGRQVAVSDVNYTLTPANNVVLYTALTAARVVTLPAASAVHPGDPIYILDGSGSCSASNTITYARAGTDTVNGLTSGAINTAYGGAILFSDGVSKWTVFSGGGGGPSLPLSIANGGTGATAAAAARTNLGLDAYAFRNRLRNATFAINQRAVSGTVTLSAGQYGHDGVKAGASGCTYTFAATGIDTTLTISAGSLIMAVEDKLVEGGAYALAHEGTAQARVWQGTGSTGTGSYGAATRAAPLTVTGLTAATQTNIEFSTGTVTRPQFEPGTQATAFERRPIGVELLLCQRYYFRMSGFSGGGVYPGFGAAAVYTTTAANAYFKYPTTMRAAPTLTQSNTALFADNAFYAVTGFGGLYMGTDGASVNLFVASGLVVGHAATWLGNNTTAAYVDGSAEI